MPDHSLIKEKIEYIFESNEEFFDSLKSSKNMDVYKNAFIQLWEEKKDLNHFLNSFISLSKACSAAINYIEKSQPSQPATSKKAMISKEVIALLVEKYSISANRERFKDRVEAAGMDRNKNLFEPDEVDRLIKHTVENFNRKKK